MKAKITTNLTATEFNALAVRYVNGEVSLDEKSRMTPALIKKLDRYAKKNK